MVESITYKYINGNLAQEYAANWKVESQNLPSGSTIETSEVPSQLTITVPANNTSSTRSGKIVLLQPASGKRITLNYSQVPQRSIISTKYFCVGNPDNGNYIYDANTETYETHVDSTISRMIFEVFKSDLYSDGTIETEGMGTTDTFEISQQSPFNGQYVTSGTLPASQDEYLLIPVTKVPWSDNGSYTEPTAIFELYLKGSQLVPYSDFYFNMSLYDAQGLFYGCNREYSQAINYKIDTVDPSDWTPSGSYSHGSITVKKGNLSPSDFSGGILIELILGNNINGYVKRVMLRIKVN